jgi:hypothetical protein
VSGEPQSLDYDFNGDGNRNIADALALILRSRGNPRDPALDLNGDGGFTIADVVELLLYLRGRL